MGEPDRQETKKNRQLGGGNQTLYYPWTGWTTTGRRGEPTAGPHGLAMASKTLIAAGDNEGSLPLGRLLKNGVGRAASSGLAKKVEGGRAK